MFESRPYNFLQIPQSVYDLLGDDLRETITDGTPAKQKYFLKFLVEPGDFRHGNVEETQTGLETGFSDYWSKSSTIRRKITVVMYECNYDAFLALEETQRIQDHLESTDRPQVLELRDYVTPKSFADKAQGFSIRYGKISIAEHLPQGNYIECADTFMSYSSQKVAFTFFEYPNQLVAA